MLLLMFKHNLKVSLEKKALVKRTRTMCKGSNEENKSCYCRVSAHKAKQYKNFQRSSYLVCSVAERNVLLVCLYSQGGRSRASGEIPSVRTSLRMLHSHSSSLASDSFPSALMKSFLYDDILY